jgi:bifunctional non-homologous end joining protein LigD
MFVFPMLARAAEESHLSEKDWTGWIMEPKHDGMRAMIHRHEDGVEIYSRTGKSQKGKCPHLEKSLECLPVGTFLDGEIALIVDETEVAGQSVPVVDFNKTMRIMGSGVDKAVLRQQEFGEVSFLLFDVVAYDGEFIDTIPQLLRNDVVDSIDCDGVVHNPRYEDDFENIYNQLVSAGVEGAILKNLDGVYEGKRSRAWLKVKSAKTFDVVVTGFTEGKGKYIGQVGAIEFSAYAENGSLSYVGRCSGMTDEERTSFTTARDSGHFFDDPTVIEVKANELVGSGEYRTPRHPQYVTVRVDKDPTDCLMEQFRAS